MLDGWSRRRAGAAHVIVEPDRLDASGPLVVDDDTAHHLWRVLRLRPGELVTLTDGAGRWRPAVVAGSGLLEPDGPTETEPRAFPPLTISTAMPKGDRIDVLVQKVTELGADRIVLLHCERSVVRWRGDRAARNLTRLQRIADEACRQSRRLWRATVEGPVDATDVLPDAIVAEPGGRTLTAADGHMAIGPEGGWTERELSLAGGSVDLGPTILRTETAAIAATARFVALPR